eukprot:351632-Chlamydomonas_euryale.AAC.2
MRPVHGRFAHASPACASAKACVHTCRCGDACPLAPRQRRGCTHADVETPARLRLRKGVRSHMQMLRRLLACASAKACVHTCRC